VQPVVAEAAGRAYGLAADTGRWEYFISLERLA
jgi:hypothetical protein